MRLEHVINFEAGLVSLYPYVGEVATIRVEMVYLPTLSVNRYKTVNGIVRYEVEKWMDDLAKVISLSVNGNGLVFFPPVKLTLDAVFKDGRHPDLSNLWKVVCDGVKEGLGIDDKYFRVRDGEVSIGGEPRLLITVRSSQQG